MPAKVFISYASEDNAYAMKLSKALEDRGVDVFQYGESAIAGRPAWRQVHDYIDRCDSFVLLVSKHSIDSRPVMRECDYAYHTHVNNEDERPSLIPVLLDESEKPQIFRAYAEIDGRTFDQAVAKLLKAIDVTSVPEPIEGVQIETPTKPPVVGLIKYLGTVVGIALSLGAILSFLSYGLTYDNDPTKQTMLYGAMGGCGGVLLSLFFRHPSIKCNWDEARMTMIAQAVLRVFVGALGGVALALLVKADLVGNFVPASQADEAFGAFKAIVGLAGVVGGFSERLIPEFNPPEAAATPA